MFTVLSDLSLIGRRELTISAATILASGLQGLWVTVDATGAIFPTAATELAWPIFNESQRDQTVGKFSPDVALTNKVTVLFGKYFARTSVFASSPTIGQALDVNTSGQLAAGTTHPVAYVVVPPRNLDYLGNTVSCMDIYVV